MPRDLSPSRLEAFSDGVIAVIITIMVLELRVPSAQSMGNTAALHQDLKLVLIYLLSFVQTGIYWVNHHYLVGDVEQVSHGILWANLIFLFTLSLIPFGTNWVGERGLTPFAVGLYSVTCVLPAITWIVLSTLICRRSGKPLAGSPAKQFASAALYIGAIPVAYHSTSIALAMIAVVAVLWLLPPRRILRETRAASTAPPSHTR
ncbi:MAG TPA: TMEM175 family protein [Acidobacteriaceae bacterium]|nr:TMEM175 family protein [Acidobacteriaceae bacterium]